MLLSLTQEEKADCLPLPFPVCAEDILLGEKPSMGLVDLPAPHP